jgi:predicted nucleic acid-binding protein
MILVDTNILLRMAQPSHTMHADAIAAVSALRTRDEVLCVVPQILYEYWAAATRPVDANGLGMTPADADADLEKIIERFRFARDERAIFQPWRRLVLQHRAIGKNAHDARLVAAMERHGIQEILTFNGADFKRYPGIIVLSPTAPTTP